MPARLPSRNFETQIRAGFSAVAVVLLIVGTLTFARVVVPQARNVFEQQMSALGRTLERPPADVFREIP